jgi:hypothetical protein
MQMSQAGGSDQAIHDITSRYYGKRLLELGVTGLYDNTYYPNKYFFSIPTDSHGWLALDTNVSPPYAGYQFKKGPVQLAGTTVSTLSSHSYAPPGSTLYCSDCTANTSPCSGSGGGALALKVENGNWNCK